MAQASQNAQREQTNALHAVGLAYIAFALENPAFFRAMWREEAIYSSDEDYMAAANKLSEHLKGGFADTIKDDDPTHLSHQELLVWSCVHGLANLYVDGPVAKDETNDQKLARASQVIDALGPALE